MSKEENVIKYYVMCNKLKDVVRTGWIDWNVSRDRVESVAEHIYGVQMLAIAMWSEYKYDIDLFKVLSMIAVHELEEILIGDLTSFQIDHYTKEKLGHEAIEKILKSLHSGIDIKKLILEFDERKTKEAYFAYQCDKLECDLQAKLYDEQGCVDLHNQERSNAAKNGEVKEYLKSNLSWSEMWLRYDQKNIDYDNNFSSISNYAISNKIQIKDN